MRARNSGTRRRLHRQAGGLLVAAEAQEQIGAALERAEHVEGRDAAARAVRDVAVDRQDDGRLVIRVDQLRRGDADHAAMPAVAADHEHVVRADRRDRSRSPSWPARRAPLPPVWRRRFSSFSCCASAARLVAHRFVGGEQQPRRDVGRAHAPGGVDPRRKDEADLIAVDRLAGQPGGVEQRAQADGVRPVLSEPRPSLAMTRFSPTSGTTSASVPIAAIFTKAGSHLRLAGAVRTAPAPASARRRRRRGACRDRCSRARFGLITASAGGSVAVRLVVVGDDQIDPELAGAQRRVGAADAAVDRDDQRDALGVQPIDRRRLQAVAVAAAARG